MTMESNRASLLTVIAVIITALAAVYVNVGPGPWIELTLISLLALAGWLGFSFRNAELSQDKILAPYILVIVLNLALNSCRYWSNFPQYLSETWHSLFAPHFAISDLSWFIVFVTCPVTLMLLGGYFLSKRTPIGFYLAWWTFLYAIVDAIVQFKIELPGSAYNHHNFVGVLAAVTQMIVAVIGCQRLLQEQPTSGRQSEAVSGLTSKQMNLWTALLVSLVAVYAVALYLQAGFLPVGVIVGSMMGGLIGWRKTTTLNPANPYKLVPLYLLLLTLFYVHVGEEALTSFNQAIASISGKPWLDREFTFLIALIGPIVWVFGAFSLWLRQPFGNFILWFMIVGMILGEPTHLVVFPVVTMFQYGVGYQYFSGMYTALFPMIPAIIALVTIIKDHQERKAQTRDA